MEFFISVALYLLLTIAIFQAIPFFLRRSNTISRKLPPGPTPLPIIGNLLNIGNKPHISLSNLAKIHGPLMTLKLGNITTIVISSAPLAKQVLQKHDLTLSDRTVPDAVRANNYHQFSMPWLPVCPQWRNLRKIWNSHIFAVQKLNSTQPLRFKKVQDLISHVQESCRAGSAVDIGQAALRTTLGALSNTALSLDLADGSNLTTTTSEFKGVIRGIMEEVAKPNLGDYFPVMRQIDLQRIRHRTGILSGKILGIFDKIINERLELRKVEGYLFKNDMLDPLLTISEQNSEEMDTTRIKMLLLDLFIAGLDTTASTLEWAMAELLRNPDILSKSQQELAQTIGKGKLLQESDIPRLPYLQAIIKETLRFHAPGPLLLPRKARADVEIDGFTIPKDAKVLVNLVAILKDPSSWENPNSFVPERFLGSDYNDVIGQNFEFLPFGAGRRMCPGLPLAMRILPLMLGSLLHSFDWRLEDGVTPQNLDMEEKFGVTFQKAQPLKAIPRDGSSPGLGWAATPGLDGKKI